MPAYISPALSRGGRQVEQIRSREVDGLRRAARAVMWIDASNRRCENATEYFDENRTSNDSGLWLYSKVSRADPR